MRITFLFFFGVSTLVFGQKKKHGLDVVSNIETKMIVMKPIGNNHLSKLLMPFYGFGFGGNLITPINFGVGLDYNVLFSNVKYGEENRYGNIGSPTITNIDFYLTHRDIISEEFSIEEMAGFSFYRQTNLLVDAKNQKLKENASGFNLGGKALYTLDREGYQQVFLAAKVNVYLNNVYNENPATQKFYNRSTFLSLGLGYRYNF
ncbi:hypothetical protein Q73A0000_11315 [Kaistella flava (ex Peng et al. 2021)]|uniref:Outer membrane protein beta-barrel domain-containing protein n=1 Tax=Kaistella flava (ex Peng et al. 2021) TaxID=2038776 RepID=A0A7M2YB91_9FLAO|nr:hypothetical protein [Kaistella flava (ex Peng et al. 2021)]QOW10905.1 hypothetical protein Q73A0000_11315 [Kaistella flava (ex Peng et al. 2021)]